MSMTQAIQAALEGMDSQGNLPERPCKRCGRPLTKQERYAGIFNGLCRICTGAPAFVTSISTLDGAMRVNHPPHRPAYRRDRQTNTGYPDCEECRGAGRVIEYRSWQAGGSYPRYCRACSDRQAGHEYRLYLCDLEHLTREGAKLEIAAAFRQALLQAGFTEAHRLDSLTEEEEATYYRLVEESRQQLAERNRAIKETIQRQAEEKRKFEPGSYPLAQAQAEFAAAKILGIIASNHKRLQLGAEES